MMPELAALSMVGTDQNAHEAQTVFVCLVGLWLHLGRVKLEKTSRNV
jgi:hypothetical protein